MKWKWRLPPSHLLASQRQRREIHVTTRQQMGRYLSMARTKLATMGATEISRYDPCLVVLQVKE